MSMSLHTNLMRRPQAIFMLSPCDIEFIDASPVSDICFPFATPWPCTHSARRFTTTGAITYGGLRFCITPRHKLTIENSCKSGPTMFSNKQLYKIIQISGPIRPPDVRRKSYAKTRSMSEACQTSDKLMTNF